MIGFIAFIFWLCIGGILHTYLFYPLLLNLIDRWKKKPDPVAKSWGELPFLSVLLSAYNEEAVLVAKLENMVALDYPPDKIQFLIGSDGSSDKTNEILASFSDKTNFQVFPFEERRGKPSVLNDLVKTALARYPVENHIFLLTDASVIIDPATPLQLVLHFKDPQIGLVDSRMVHTGLTAAGISRSEDAYISREVRIKYLEGKLWGAMIGPFGGCFALRAELYEPIPGNYLVDDFFLAMQVFRKGAKAINELDALAFEPVSHDLKEEYRRKSRISAGNFQNLVHFRDLWWPPFKPRAFAFFSHKILRWLSPFLMLFSALISGGLALSGNQFYTWVFLFQILIVVLPLLLDAMLRALNIHSMVFRSLRYFWMMNIALIKGFFRYLKGIQKGTWEPPKRTVS